MNQTQAYLQAPENESCYRYLLRCHANISADVGADYVAFNAFDCDTMMEDLFDEVERLAAGLAARGIGKNDVVGVFLPTCSHGVTIFYALSKLGVIADFIHPLTPPASLKKMLADTGAKAVFLLDRAAAPYREATEGLLTIVCSFADHTRGAVKAALEAQSAGLEIPGGATPYRALVSGALPRVPDAEKGAKETAVYMHGSGTTGVSKTVCLSAYALNSSAYSQYQIDVYHDYGHAYSLAVLPFFHAFGLGAALHYAICNAYAPILMPKFDAHKANEIIARYNVQYIDGVPNMFRKMFEADNFDNPGLKSVTCVYSGGDIVSEAFVERFNTVLAKNGSVAKLFRGWGLTEMCAVCSTNCHGAHRANSIGRIGYGMQIKIIDEEGKTLAPNEQGEICLTGSTIMNGYLPDENVDFTGLTPDENGVNWVRTGDMGYVDEDGYIFFTGRKKRIIVISGYNVYPYSIEQQISALPFVAEACAVQGYDGDRPIVKLCVVLNENAGSEEEARKEILDYCEANFNRFSVPRKIVFMQALPRTKMDKMDFLAMSDPVPN